MVSVLCLNSAGQPHRWSSIEDAAIYTAKDLVLWQHGESIARLRGGYNARSLQRSVLDVPAIMAVRGEAFFDGRWEAPKVSRALVFLRDRRTCAYCGRIFPDAALTVDHIVPVSRAGCTTWMNVVAACKRCNALKADRDLAAFGELLYLPYVPNKHEALILANRRILADQHDWLQKGLPRHSRLRLQ